MTEELTTYEAPSGDGIAPSQARRTEQHMARAVQPQNLDGVIRLAKIFYESGYFSDIQNVSQAIAKMVAGAELGLKPMEAMRSIHAFDGQTTLHYTQILSLIRKHRRYDYEDIESTSTRAEIAFWRYAREEWREAGRQVWTKEDARRAGLTGKRNWKNYPRAMLLGRAATEGQRKFCPDVGGGPLYVPEELGAATDADGRAIPDRPTSKNAPQRQQTGAQAPPEPPTAKQKELVQQLLESSVWTEKEHQNILGRLERYGKARVSEMIDGMRSTMDERKAAQEAAQEPDPEEAEPEEKTGADAGDEAPKEEPEPDEESEGECPHAEELFTAHEPGNQDPA